MLPPEQAGMLASLHVEQRLPMSELADFVDVSTLLANQCCELHVDGYRKVAPGVSTRSTTASDTCAA